MFGKFEGRINATGCGYLFPLFPSIHALWPVDLFRKEEEEDAFGMQIENVKMGKWDGETN